MKEIKTILRKIEIKTILRMLEIKTIFGLDFWCYGSQVEGRNSAFVPFEKTHYLLDQCDHSSPATHQSSVMDDSALHTKQSKWTDGRKPSNRRASE